MQELLRYFQNELAANEQLRDEFARRFPSLASNLGMHVAGAEQDPHVARLLQGVALMNARTAMRVDRSHDRLTEALLNVSYPHYLRPFPSCTIVQFDASSRTARSQLETAVTVPRGTALHGPVIDGVRYQFRTVYPVEVAPIALASARFEPAHRRPVSAGVPSTVTHFVSLTFQSLADSAGLAPVLPNRLPVFIDADLALGSSIRDTLFMRSAGAWLEAEQSWSALPQPILHPLGFAQDDAILPFPARSHPAYRLLFEFWCFPEKFNFASIDLGAIRPSLPRSPNRFTLHIGIALEKRDDDLVEMLGRLAPDNLRLACTPAVNLFAKAASPIDLNHTKTEYILPSDTMNPRAFDIFTIDSVTAQEGTADSSELVEYHPYYSLKHGLAEPRGRYWLGHRDEQLAQISPGYEHSISFVDLAFNPLDAKAASVSINLTCTNGDLPARMPVGAPNGDLNMAEPIGNQPIRVLRRPTPTYRFSSKDHWRLISHLALNHSSLMGDDISPLAEILMLYNLPRTSSAQKQIEGIAALSIRPARTIWREKHCTGFLHGVEVRLIHSEPAYAGTGLHAFAQLLDHFFGLYVQINSFVQLVVISSQTGKEILRCAPRSGAQAPL